MEMLSAGVSDRHLEIMRGDLAQIVVEATRGQVEYIFGRFRGHPGGQRKPGRRDL